MSGSPLEHSDQVLVAIFSPRGEFLLTGTKDGQVCLWKADNGVLFGKPGRQDSAVQAAAFHPDGLTEQSGERTMVAVGLRRETGLKSEKPGGFHRLKGTP